MRSSGNWARGRVAVVTGAGSGLGRALAQRLARHGARLAVSDIDEAGLAETVRLLDCAGAAVHSECLDVTDRAAVLAYAAAVADHFGTVDVMVNNAGIAFTGDVTAMTFEQVEHVLDVDFWGVVNGTKAFLPYLIASGDGRLVNISSVFGLVGVPGQSAYNAAKFAVRGFTEALGQELRLAGHPVRVTCVHPGGVKTAIARNAGAVETQDAARLAEVFDRKLARTSAEAAARTILRGVERGRVRVLVGRDAALIDAAVRLLGPRYQDLAVRFAARATAARATPPRAAGVAGVAAEPMSAFRRR